jgi:hypothetical protein
MLVPLNQISNRSDPFTKQKDANSNSGVVGNTGRMTPNSPKPKEIKPIMIYIILITFLMVIASSFSWVSTGFLLL